MTRAVAAARLYVVNKWMLIGIPLIIIGAMLALTLGIQLIADAAGGGSQIYFNGAFQTVFWCLMGVAIAASTQVFPFAFAMSLTRRDFLFGTLITAVGVAIGYGLIHALLAWVEGATGGFGINTHGFDLMGFVTGGPWNGFVLYGGLILLFFLIGFAASMLWKRFSGKGLVVAGLVGVTVMSLLAMWAGLANAWPSVFGWFTRQTPMSIGGYAVAASLLLAGASYLLIRHAEP